jgi:hypothetical protein
VETVTLVNTKIVRLLQAGTTLTALNDHDKSIHGTVEAYRFVQHTFSDKSTDYEIEYRVRWSDGVYEWISWPEIDCYDPVRPKRIPVMRRELHREYINA